MEELYDKIKELALELGFADVGCARAGALDADVTAHYRDALASGFFGQMSYLERNTEKREDPTLLLPGAKSVLVFLAPFSFLGDASAADSSAAAVPAPRAQGGSRNKLKVSEFALGIDYHAVIKEKLYKIAALLDGKFRVFTDSAPIMERAWAVRADLGFIGKNNFLISRKCGVKNFIGIILTTVELPYYKFDTEVNKKDGGENFFDVCGNCTRCIDACSQKALFAPRRIDARKCLSYKTIEERIAEESDEGCNAKGRSLADVSSKKVVLEADKWIFGCDDCMNACPWNRLNLKGWEEFHTNAHLLRSASAIPQCVADEPSWLAHCNTPALDSDDAPALAPGETPEWWLGLTQEKFDELFSNSPLQRAGLKKIVHNFVDLLKVIPI